MKLTNKLLFEYDLIEHDTNIVNYIGPTLSVLKGEGLYEATQDYMKVIGLGAVGLAAVVGIAWWASKMHDKRVAKMQAIVSQYLSTKEIMKINAIINGDAQYLRLKHEYSRVTMQQKQMQDLVDQGTSMQTGNKNIDAFSPLVNTLGSMAVQGTTQRRLDDLNADMQQRMKDIIPKDIYEKLQMAQYALERDGFDVEIVGNRDF